MLHKKVMEKIQKQAHVMQIANLSNNDINLEIFSTLHYL